MHKRLRPRSRFGGIRQHKFISYGVKGATSGEEFAIAIRIEGFDSPSVHTRNPILGWGF